VTTTNLISSSPKKIVGNAALSSLGTVLPTTSKAIKN